MRARQLLGRTVVGVRWNRFYNRNVGRTVTALTGLVLDNGAVLVLDAAESHGEPYVVGQVVKPEAADAE